MAKLITKFKYIKPGNGAGSYLKYIATREGVEKIDDSKKLLPTTAKQKILIAKLLRDFPDSREMLEYEDYRAEKTIGAASEFITRAIEDNAHSMMTSKTYADYIATRPRAERFGSHGLFTDDGVEIKLTEVSEELNRHEGNVWTAIVSLRREDAERLGFNRGARWRDMLRTQTQALSENLKIPMENLRWYSVPDQGNRRVEYAEKKEIMDKIVEKYRPDLLHPPMPSDDDGGAYGGQRQVMADPEAQGGGRAPGRERARDGGVSVQTSPRNRRMPEPPVTGKTAEVKSDGQA